MNRLPNDASNVAKVLRFEEDFQTLYKNLCRMRTEVYNYNFHNAKKMIRSVAQSYNDMIDIVNR